MKRLLLALGLALSLCAGAQAQLGAIGPPPPPTCNKVVSVTGTAALAQVIAGVSGQIVAICGWSFTNTAASGTFLIATGTGANCGTNTVNLTPALSVGATAVTDHSAAASQNVVAGNAICVNATATITGLLYYSQF